jgi:pyrroloquinoline-quinone synthase
VELGRLANGTHFCACVPEPAAEALKVMTTEKTLRALDNLIRRRSILQHPFYRAWQRGELTQDQLATYARVYHPHVAAFPNYLRNAIACTRDSSTKLALQQNLEGELTNPAPHPELWLNFATATGQDRQAVASAKPARQTAETVAAFDRLTRRDIASALTTLYAYESQQPEVAMEKLRGLRGFYRIQSSEGLSYFTVHATADVEHRAAERLAIGRCLDSGTSSTAIMHAAEEALDGYWNLLDGICEEADLQLTEA